MEVSLVGYTRFNPTFEYYSDNALVRIARVCTGREDKELDNEEAEAFLKKLAARGHYSVFEHVSLTFEVKGISRACSLQLARHRHMSRTERSQRYCDLSKCSSKELDELFMTPREVEANEPALKSYKELLAKALKVYKGLIRYGMRPEDARFVLPEATKTNMFISLNLRTLAELHEKRVKDTGAQWEIKQLVEEMCKQARAEEHLIYAVNALIGDGK